MLERKELAGRLRQSGRPDLADQLEAGDPAPAVEETEPSAEPEPLEHEPLAKRLDQAQSRWISLVGSDAA